MTNIWTQSFEEVRKPFFEMEDPYTLREKKEKEENEDGPKRWWDDDGDGVGYEKGEVQGKFKKKKVKEEVEEVGENVNLQSQSSKRKSLGKYKGKYESPKEFRKTEIKDAPYQYKGNYNAHLKKEEVEEVGEEMKPLPKNKMFRKAGNLGRDIVSSSTGDEDRQKKYGRQKKIIKQLNKEEYIDEVNDSKETRLDVRKGIKNKVEINPQIKEELETWIGELVEEGYDLSQFTWQEMFEIYESAEFIDEGTAGMPAAGDAQTVTVDPIAVAKVKAAKAKVAKERADLQVAQQSQRLKVSTNESFDSIVEYLSQRPNAFENLEEGVFDPKKSKMRPASERSKNAMTDAQRKAEKKEAQRTAEIHSKGETVLAGLMPQGKKGKVKTTPTPKAAAPASNRKVKGRYDKLAAAANKVLKDIKK